MAAGDLVTLAQVQTAYPALDAYQLADLPQLIAAVSYEIGRRYPRAAPAATYDETHNPGLARTFFLKQRPVLRVRRLRADLWKVMTLAYSGPARRATAEVLSGGEADRPTAAALELATGAAGAEDVTELNFPDHPTLGDLADAVNAMTGWRCTLDTAAGGDPRAMASADVEPNQGARPAAGGIGAAFYAYTRDMWDWNLNPLTGEILLYEWRIEGYQNPDRWWGTDPRNSSVRVAYDAGRNQATPDVQRAAIITIGAALEETDKPGVLLSRRSADSGYQMADPTYRLPGAAERALSRYKNRRFA